MVDVAPHTLGLTPRKRLLAEGLFHLIGERIISGELPPGARIRDAQIAAELAVSRTPVREALQRLERLGLVTMYPSRYTEVTTVDPERVASARVFAGLQTGMVVRLACPRLSDRDADAAIALVEEIPRTAHDPARHAQARRALVAHLLTRIDDPLLHTLVGEAELAVARALRSYRPPADHLPVLITACEDLAAALRARDPDAAEHAVRRIYEVP